MSADHRTAVATGTCIAMIGAGLALLSNVFDWPTTRLVQSGRLLTQTEIVLYDVLPIVASGFAIGLVAIAVTRFAFPRSNIKVILAVVSAVAVLLALFALWLSLAIGAQNIRDYGVVAMLLAIPSAIGLWATLGSTRSKA